MNSRRVDCLAFAVENDERHFMLVSNSEILELIQMKAWASISEEARQMFEKVLASSRTRQLCRIDLGSLLDDDHESRYRRYRKLMIDATRSCVDRLAAKSVIGMDKIALVITTSTVLSICPPLSSIIVNQLKLAPSTLTLDLSHMGCAGLLWAVELAGRLLQPGKAAFILGAELTSAMSDLHGRQDALLAASVFGDGVAGLVVARPPHVHDSILQFRQFSGSLLCSDKALECIYYDAGPVFPQIHLSESISEIAGEGIRLALRPLIEDRYVTFSEKLLYLIKRRDPRWQSKVDYFVVHTAGTKILANLQKELHSDYRQFSHNSKSFDVYGNTSSTSVLYSLNELIGSRSLHSGEQLLFLTYGSGFMTKAASATVS
jgi:3-oxoacyl-[acyl-carrier-protein] synthase-3